MGSEMCIRDSMETVRKQTRTQADPVEGELAAINALGNTSLTADGFTATLPPCSVAAFVVNQ